MPENGLRSIRETEPGDIFICSYPRSGVTWFQNLVASVVHGVDAEFAHDSLIQDLVPDVAYKLWYKRYGATAYFKSHELPQKSYRRVVYLLRDGRDVMVSYHHFLSALHGSIDFDELVQGKCRFAPLQWHDHVKQWMTNPFGAEMIVIKYEDLQTAPVRELSRFCEFARLDRSNAHLERIVSQASFDKARTKERQMGWDNKAWPADKPFIRRGIIGSHQDEMPALVLDTFLEKAGSTLRHFSYAS